MEDKSITQTEIPTDLAKDEHETSPMGESGASNEIVKTNSHKRGHQDMQASGDQDAKENPRHSTALDPGIKYHDEEDQTSDGGAKRRKTSTPSTSSPLQEDLDGIESRPMLTLTSRKDDLFAHPTPALLIHACNCLGLWGQGVARTFFLKYPHHFQQYKAHCQEFASEREILLGTALLIPPDSNHGKSAGRGGSGNVDTGVATGASDRAGSDWVGCLFTRVSPGASRSLKSSGKREEDTRETLEATASSMRALLRLVADAEAEGRMKKGVGWAIPRINAGLFKVPWVRTVEVLERLRLDDEGEEKGLETREIVVYAQG